MLQLVSPSVGLVASYRRYLTEFEAAGEELYPFTTGYPHHPAKDFVARLEAESRGEGLAPGYVAHSTYWLTLDDEVVGVSNLRHEMTPYLLREGGHVGYGVRPSYRGNGYATELLRQTLVRAAQRGIGRVLLVSAASNQASIRTILANGGMFEDAVISDDDGETMNRYWIDLTGKRRGTPGVAER